MEAVFDSFSSFPFAAVLLISDHLLLLSSVHLSFTSKQLKDQVWWEIFQAPGVSILAFVFRKTLTLTGLEEFSSSVGSLIAFNQPLLVYLLLVSSVFTLELFQASSFKTSLLIVFAVFFFIILQFIYF